MTISKREDKGVAPSSRSRSAALRAEPPTASQAKPAATNAGGGVVVCPRCGGWGNTFNEADQIYVRCDPCAGTGRTIDGSARELAETLRKIIIPGGPDRVRLPSGAWLEGEGATAYADLVRAFVGLLDRWTAPAQGIEAFGGDANAAPSRSDESPAGNADAPERQGQ